MTKDRAESSRLTELRKRAEAMLEREAIDIPDMSPEEARKLVHELRTHQIELEMQNEELRRAQDELVESRDRYSDLYDFAPVGYVTVSHKGLILEANLTLADMLRVERRALVKQRLSAFIVPDDHNAFYRYRREILESRQRHTCRFRMLRRDAEPLWVEMDSILIEADDESDPRLRMAIIDITERVRAEEALQRVQRLESIGTLAGGIAHDFNNLLLGVFGNVSIAREQLSKDHPASDFLERAESTMDRAIRLTKQLLTFARGGGPVKEDVDIGKLVEESVRSDLSGSNVMPVFEQAEDLWMADVDKGQVEQVLSNLTVNASQAMPDGGHLYITLENAEISEDAVPDLNPGRFIKVTVRDEGTGIDKNDLDRIFDPYFSTRQTGSGLGLATAYSIIKKHGGHIEVDSELGKGTTFVLLLPASESQHLPGSPHLPETEPAVAERLTTEPTARILVMDDEGMIREVTAEMLERSGYSAEAADGGKQAIEMYKQAMDAGRPFDGVIMDLTIPGGIGGEEAIRGILAIDPDAVAIVSSGYADDPVLAHYAEYGFKGVLAKPYTMSQLQDVLSRILEE